ncbi:hypothetical protein P154DRAFT_97481 [Amniculicola lignicola CBS 123094]|uniref:Uncharacterized protein n=1 Tax=Amniculicola lignicola CBS 123094 TaxID=1392246 RepID=A0A6A5VW00_9PLEO|nr:hypothetical protein P154DRAFT_97481 [Amniculicola lignicola CBS 123094]
MHFPSWPTPDNLVPCFLSLEIYKEDVKELAMVLFKVEVDWIADVFQVVHHNGMVQIIPHSEFTLKGVLDDDVVAVFGAKIHSAIAECPVRARELAEGKRRTECVSMTFSKDEGTISLTMGLETGVLIQNKLNSKITT